MCDRTAIVDPETLVERNLGAGLLRPPDSPAVS
jgi:hypothetical protein